jgi:predicted TIM-barrel fold metal-dependent hydrolase
VRDYYLSFDYIYRNGKDDNLARSSIWSNLMQDATWLNQVQEEIIDPARPICDPHHHLWDRNGSRYLLDEILDDINAGHRIVSTVFVECDSMFNIDAPAHLAPVGETEFVQGVAAMSSSGQYGECRVADGIVSFADLTLGDGVREVLEAHLAVAPRRFKGIRHAASWHVSDEIRNSHSGPVEHQMLKDDFQAGFEVLGSMNLSFDAWCYHTQIDEFAELARSHPTVTIILDHFGGPLGIGPYRGQGEAVFAEWRENISQLKDNKNVYFKLGGINMKINGFDWHKREVPANSDELVDRTARYYEHCIDTFGADRCMFESNFPVDRESVSYHVLWNAFKKMSAHRTEAEKERLFLGTATEAYRL